MDVTASSVYGSILQQNKRITEHATKRTEVWGPTNEADSLGYLQSQSGTAGKNQLSLLYLDPRVGVVRDQEIPIQICIVD
jgi:hypothetical protein